MRYGFESISLHSPKSGSRYPSTAFKFSKVCIFKRKRLSLNLFHFFYGLCYYFYVFENGDLNAPLFTELQGGGTEYAVYPGQSITFTYRAKADADLAGVKDLVNKAALSNNDGPIKLVEVPVKVVAPADDNPADSGAADADTTAKAESALDSSPKCGDTFLFGWLFKLLGIAN